MSTSWASMIWTKEEEVERKRVETTEEEEEETKRVKVEEEEVATQPEEEIDVKERFMAGLKLFCEIMHQSSPVLGSPGNGYHLEIPIRNLNALNDKIPWNDLFEVIFKMFNVTAEEMLPVAVELAGILKPRGFGVIHDPELRYITIFLESNLIKI